MYFCAFHWLYINHPRPNTELPSVTQSICRGQHYDDSIGMCSVLMIFLLFSKIDLVVLFIVIESGVTAWDSEIPQVSICSFLCASITVGCSPKCFLVQKRWQLVNLTSVFSVTDFHACSYRTCLFLYFLNWPLNLSGLLHWLLCQQQLNFLCWHWNIIAVFIFIFYRLFQYPLPQYYFFIRL